MSLTFLTEPEPARGVRLPVLPGISRIVAENPGRMTYHGTNTYLMEGPDGVTVLDPGPASAAHVATILRTAPGRVVRILLSHTHEDHLGATAALRDATGAPVAAWHTSADGTFIPDIPLHDAEEVAGMVALFTPGHAADHLCFVRPDGVVFSADHVMGWSTSVVEPPGGDMAAYFASLHRMLDRTGDRLYLPGHGPPIPEPRAYVAALLEHRQAREQAILDALQTATLATPALADALYPAVDPQLRRAAERNVMAHLIKLEGEGRVVRRGEGWGLPRPPGPSTD